MFLSLLLLLSQAKEKPTPSAKPKTGVQHFGLHNLLGWNGIEILETLQNFWVTSQKFLYFKTSQEKERRMNLPLLNFANKNVSE